MSLSQHDPWQSNLFKNSEVVLAIDVAEEALEASAIDIEKAVKVQPNLLPWNSIMEVGKLMTMMCDTNGGKHSKDQWKQVSIESHMDAAIRHYAEWHSGKLKDEESKLNPLVHMACRLLMALSNELEKESENVLRKSY